MSKDNGGPAFPCVDEEVDAFNGMTLRDYFAAKAMQSLMLRAWQDTNGNVPSDIFEKWATGAYKAADAMLAERNK